MRARKMNRIKSKRSQDLYNIEFVTIRRIPYPYQSMLALCSDLDETPDKHKYLETMRFLNTTEPTTMGKGLGLETGNTIYFDMPSEQFSYWNTDSDGRGMIRSLIKSGHIDCLHSYGDFATTREHAQRALDELSRNNCRLEVWIDHGIAPSNFGQDIMRGRGDVKDSEIYHADITTDFGIKYVWCGRVTSIIGQDTKRGYAGIFYQKYPIQSFKTILKEFSKVILSNGGYSKYTMHKSNRLMRPVQLRSGQKVFEFIRSNPHWGGVSCGDTADGLGDIITDDTLSHLVRRGGFSILYTHLGKFKTSDKPFAPPSLRALKLLSEYSKGKKILVTATSRILRYCQAIRNLNFSTSVKEDHLIIDISTESDEKELEGLTFYVADPMKTHLVINGRDIRKLQLNPPDHTNQASVSLPWRPLAFPTI